MGRIDRCNCRWRSFSITKVHSPRGRSIIGRSRVFSKTVLKKRFSPQPSDDGLFFFFVSLFYWRLEIVMAIWYLSLAASNSSLVFHLNQCWSQLVLGVLLLLSQIFSCHIECKNWYFLPFCICLKYCNFLDFIAFILSSSLSIFLKTSTFVTVLTQNPTKTPYFEYLIFFIICFLHYPSFHSIKKCRKTNTLI